MWQSQSPAATSTVTFPPTPPDTVSLVGLEKAISHCDMAPDRDQPPVTNYAPVSPLGWDACGPPWSGRCLHCSGNRSLACVGVDKIETRCMELKKQSPGEPSYAGYSTGTGVRKRYRVNTKMLLSGSLSGTRTRYLTPKITRLKLNNWSAPPHSFPLLQVKFAMDSFLSGVLDTTQKVQATVEKLKTE